MTKKQKKDITAKRDTFKPFTYDFAYDAWLKHEQAHWLHTEVPMAEDVKDYKQKMSHSEQLFLTKILRFFVQGDLDIGGAYLDYYIPAFKNPEVRMMMAGFAGREALHVAAYAHLIETLGLPESTYNEFLNYAEMVEKHEYLNKVKDMGIPERIAAISAFGEGMQLFSSFVMLLNFARNGKLKGVGQIISWSISDEASEKTTLVFVENFGWKEIQHVTLEDRVMQYDMESQKSSFQNIKKIQKVQRDETYIFEGENFHQHVSPNHRMIFKKDNVVSEERAQNLQDLSNVEFINDYSSEKRLQLKDFDNLKPISNVTVTKIKHDTPQELYCLAVPGKAFWIKSNDQISVTGNTMHAEGMIKVFREYVKENKEEVWNDVTKKNIYDIAREMVALEDKFLDLAFDMIEVERLTKDEVKQYIRYIADSRLISMGMKPIFKVKNNPLPWVEAMLGASHTNFFEQRVTDYAKGALTGSWEDVWGAVKK